MSLLMIKQQIHNFLQSDEPEVLSIRGAWGVGKTFAWNKYLLEYRDTINSKYTGYAYISLFGINTLESLKYSIFENSVNKEAIGHPVSLDSFKSHIANSIMSLSKKSLHLIVGTPAIQNYLPPLQSLSFLTISHNIICFDDLERKGSTLDIKDVMGLISNLKEQKNCKIIILLNSDESGLEDYYKYREKVVDIEINFDPSSTESTSIAFDNKDSSIQKTIEFCTRLNINNIRILKKIERLVKQLQKILIEYDDSIVEQAIQSAVLFAWSYYAIGQNTPSFEFVTNLGYGSWGHLGSTSKEIEHADWLAILSDYGYRTTDEFDSVIANGIKLGYFDEKTLQNEANKKQQTLNQKNSLKSFNDAWDLFHHNLNVDQEVVLSSLIKATNENLKYINASNLNGTIIFLREFDKNQEASSIIDDYIRIHIDEPNSFDLENNHIFGDSIDLELKVKFGKAYSKAMTPMSLSEIMEKISIHNTWNDVDLSILENTSVEEYYDYFKSTQSRTLHGAIKICLQFEHFSTPSANRPEITIRVKKALRRIASESKMNEVRLKKYDLTENKEK